LADSTVYENDRQLRKGNTLCFPALWKKNNSWVAYSQSNSDLLFTLPAGWKGVKVAEIFLITKNGLVKKTKERIKGNQMIIKLTGRIPVLILPAKK
jgi:hypothetical protein